MSTLITLALLVAYAATWLTTAVAGTRWAADRGRCHDRIRSWTYVHCREYDGPNCWRSDGITPGLTLAVTGIALAWPLLAPPALVYWAATRRPTPVGLQTRIDELERELGIGGDR